MNLKHSGAGKKKKKKKGYNSKLLWINNRALSEGFGGGMC